MKKLTNIFLLQLLLIVILFSYKSIFILAFFWIILHEIAHIIVGYFVGAKLYDINLSIMGVNATLNNIDEIADIKKLLVYIAGPGFNIMMAIVLYALSMYCDSGFIIDSINLNLSLGVFNLLPAYPLDGSKILEILLSKNILYQKANTVVSNLSYIIASGFIVLSIILQLEVKRLNISMIIVAIFIIYITRKQQKRAMYITMGNLIIKRRKLITNSYLQTNILSIYYKVQLVNVLALVDRDKFNSFYVLDDDMKLIYIMHEDELIEGLKNYGNISLEEYVYKNKI